MQKTKYLKILNFLHQAEQLKNELRHSKTSAGRKESVAEHSWRTALMVLLFSPYLKKKINIEKALSLAIIHDLGEAVIGDEHYLKIAKNPLREKNRKLQERKAIKCLTNKLGTTATQIKDLWNDYEKLTSYEAKFVHVIDKLEAWIQHNEAKMSTWTKKEIKDIFNYSNRIMNLDIFINNFKKCLLDETIKKFRKHNIKPEI
ncbi:MAG: hypothetical protein KR126chlam6_01121 [Candidatus Anoxychlamydiales bacterium]|nr:hypothetical protein [Candidatus Anoxychlamydiales bacterium]